MCKIRVFTLRKAIIVYTPLQLRPIMKAGRILSILFAVVAVVTGGCTQKNLEPRLDTPVRMELIMPDASVASNYEVLFLKKDGMYHNRKVDDMPRSVGNTGIVDAVVPAGRYNILVMVNRLGRFDLYPVPLVPGKSHQRNIYITPTQNTGYAGEDAFLIGYAAECQVHNHQEPVFRIVMEELEPGENFNLGDWISQQ